VTTINAYGERRAADVMQETWGHLAGQRGRSYDGSVVYALGRYGDLAVITAEFQDLPDSPWFYEHLHEWIWDQKPEEGSAYHFKGSYRRDRPCKFEGETTRLDLTQKGAA
jgi:hypothetical protein